MNGQEAKEINRLAAAVEELSRTVQEGLRESAVGLEAVHGEIAILETVVRSHMSQQASTNDNFANLIRSHDQDIRKLEKHVAYFAGGIAILISLAQLAPPIIRVINGG